jgi:hypothetical protein
VLRLCFERLPGHTPLEKQEDFLAWVDTNFPDLEYRFGGYIVQNLGDMWFGQNVLWNILLDNNMELLALIEREGWIIDGYCLHVYIREPGSNEVKISNKAFQISRDEARTRAAAR